MAKQTIDRGMIMKALDWGYEQAVEGVPGLDTAEEIGDDYKAGWMIGLADLSAGRLRRLVHRVSFQVWGALSQCPLPSLRILPVSCTYRSG